MKFPKVVATPIAAFLLAFLLGYLIVTNLMPGKVVGFRGGSEAIGGRTGGDAYSGGDAQLQPGDV